MLNVNNIKSISKKKDISLLELSKRSEISYQGLMKLLNNKSTTTDTLEKIAKALHTPICEFFDTPQHTAEPGSTDNLRLQMLEKEIEHLRRELASKDKIIKLLEKRVGG